MCYCCTAFLNNCEKKNDVSLTPRNNSCKFLDKNFKVQLAVLKYLNNIIFFKWTEAPNDKPHYVKFSNYLGVGIYSVLGKIKQDKNINSPIVHKTETSNHDDNSRILNIKM